MAGDARRAAPPAVRVLVDLLGHARSRRSWIPLVLLAMAAVAALLAVVGQAAAPWAIYPAL